MMGSMETFFILGGPQWSSGLARYNLYGDHSTSEDQGVHGSNPAASSFDLFSEDQPIDILEKDAQV